LNYIRAAENTEELAYRGEFVSLLSKVRNELTHERSTDVDKKIRSFVNDRSMAEETTTIHFRIIEEPLTPQNLALILNALTELTTKFWLIANHRFADLIEYTQTHDIRFANEAGTTIAWITQNSPLNFGLNVDNLIPGVAEAVMTIVDGLTQRKGHLEQLELQNQTTAQKIKDEEEKLKQQQEMAAIEREKQEIALEKLRLANEKERQALIELRLESQRKQIEDALELAGKAVDIVYPNADAEMRPMLIQTVMNSILQLQSATGLQTIFISLENKPKEDAGQ
jgi:flagellar biosynthesis GTPase FlhF